jgi:hypothetical protein
LETEYDDYMTYYQKMEFENELPSFEGFFKMAHYNSDLDFAGYQSKQDFLKDFEQKFVISSAYKQIETLYNRVFKTSVSFLLFSQKYITSFTIPWFRICQRTDGIHATLPCFGVGRGVRP